MPLGSLHGRRSIYSSALVPAMPSGRLPCADAFGPSSFLGFSSPGPWPEHARATEQTLVRL